MRWLEHAREHLNVTALEARALLIVSTVLTLGTAIQYISRTDGLHDHATAVRIAQILDSLQTVDTAVTVDAPAQESQAQLLDMPSSRSPARRSINLNSASEVELDALPGIGPSTARAITEARARNRFTSVDDLLDVKGIGEKKLERIRPYVVVP